MVYFMYSSLQYPSFMNVNPCEVLH